MSEKEDGWGGEGCASLPGAMNTVTFSYGLQNTVLTRHYPPLFPSSSRRLIYLPVPTTSHSHPFPCIDPGLPPQPL
eukprot:761746-Hanusia_phi.AAC.5